MGKRAKPHLLIAITPHHSLAPDPSPHPTVRGKIVFHETGPWCQKGWDRCSRVHISLMRVCASWREITREALGEKLQKEP